MVLKIINNLNRGDITLKKVIRLTKLFSVYLLVLLNKYRGLINILKVTICSYNSINTSKPNIS